MVVELLSLLAVTAGVVDAAPPHRPLEAGVRRLVGLDADDRVQALLAGLPVEVEDAVHVPVVGDPDGGLAVGGCGADDVLDPGRPVEHRELTVDVEVGKALAAASTRHWSNLHRTSTGAVDELHGCDSRG